MQVIVLLPHKTKKENTTKKDTNFKIINDALQENTYYIDSDTIYRAQDLVEELENIVEYLDDEDNQFTKENITKIQNQFDTIKHFVEYLDNFVIENTIED